MNTVTLLIENSRHILCRLTITVGVHITQTYLRAGARAHSLTIYYCAPWFDFFLGSILLPAMLCTGWRWLQIPGCRAWMQSCNMPVTPALCTCDRCPAVFGYVGRGCTPLSLVASLLGHKASVGLCWLFLESSPIFQKEPLQ